MPLTKSQSFTLRNQRESISFCSGRGRCRGENESEWYYKYCSVRQGRAESTLINIIGRVEETQDSHDRNAVTDESHRLPLPGDPPLLTVLLTSEEIWRRVIRHKSSSVPPPVPFTFSSTWPDQWGIHKQAWRISETFTLRGSLRPYSRLVPTTDHSLSYFNTPLWPFSIICHFFS